jgi:hypothetical protein
MFSKKAQVGETMTWIVATIIIIVILVASIFISTAYLGGGKSINFFKTTDTLASKSLFSYLLTKDDEGNLIYNQLKNEDNLNQFNGNLGKEIFQEFYSEEYGNIWLGILTGGLDLDSPKFLKNDYFGDRPKDILLLYFNSKNPVPNPGVSEEVQLNEDKFIELALKHRE